MSNYNDGDEEEIYTFVVEWFDSVADLSRKYNLRYWPKDNSLSMYDLTKNRLFLKRIVNKDITFPNDLYVGKTIVVYSRQLKIIDYADLFTKNKFESISKSYNILFVGFKSFTTFLTAINKYNNSPFHFKAIKSIRASPQIQQYLKIEKENEILIMCEFVGSKNIESALNECKNNNDNFSGTLCDEDADKSLITAMNESKSSAELSEDCVTSLCVIKPHCLSSAASIIEDILNEGYFVTAITTKKLTLSQAKDFYEVYNGVIKEYNYLIEQLLSGSVIALQIHCNSIDVENKENNDKQNDENQEINTNRTFNEFRDFVGPKDPEIAKYIRPHTLRAKYGVDRIQNALHCTDLQQDGILESKFFFAMI